MKTLESNITEVYSVSFCPIIDLERKHYPSLEIAVTSLEIELSFIP